MKRHSTLAWFAWVTLSTLVVFAAPGDAQWKKVQDAMQQGLPKSAIQSLEPIIQEAIANKRWAEAIRALGQKIALEGTIEGNKPEEKITRLKAEIDKAPDEMKPVLRAILAHWHWHYFQHNKWRFMQRTQTAAPPGDDLTTWDLPRILQEIDKHFTASLATADQLKQIKIADYADLLQPGNVPDTYRPTLYDFLVHSALEFYAAGEQAGNAAEDAFEASADSPVLAGLAEFIAWQPQTTDAGSLKLRAIRLYQDVLRFHLNDADPAARLDADIHRLVYAKNMAVGDEKEERYIAALQKIADANATHELSSKALYHIAQQRFDDGDRVEARKAAMQGRQRFPQSHGGRLCQNLIAQIEAPGSQITIERVWNEPRPTIDVQYRNLTKIYFRAVTVDYEGRLKQLEQSKQAHRQLVNRHDDAERQKLLAAKPVMEWNADLPATDDYHERTERLAIPAGLKPGAYVLLASHNAAFNDQNNVVSAHEFWVSDVALVLRTNIGPNTVEGFTLHAVSGEPLSKAEVLLYSYDQNGRFALNATGRSDDNGKFRVQVEPAKQHNYYQHIVYVRHAAGRMSSGQNLWLGQGYSPAGVGESTVFFTDRALYRPGQTVHFKGICIRSAPANDTYHTIPQKRVTVVFNDVNGKEIEKRELTTTDYGSFSGSFTAPRDRLMGRMNIVAVNGNGATQVSVEEYKRPKFQVKLEAPQEAAKLHGEVKLTGKATAYTGAAIDGAQVRWRVVREVRYPAWWFWRCWWMPYPESNSQEIAHGSTTTDTAGAFHVQFSAKPDLSVDPTGEPTFNYTIHADVTDTAGETRSDQRSVNVGYTALAATLSADEWQSIDKPVQIKLNTTTLDGEAQAAAGTVKIFKVIEPEKVQRARLADQHQNYSYPGTPRGRGKRATVAVNTPPAADPANVNSWPTGDVVHEQAVQTDATGELKFDVKLPLGLYRAKLTTQDRFGKPVTAELPLRVLDPAATKLALKVPNLFDAPHWQLEPGQEFLAVWGTGYDTGRAFVEIEHRNKIVRSYWTPSGQTQVQIKDFVTEAYRGGFQVRVTQVRENRAYLQHRRVEVPWSNKELKLRWEHITSKLEPGQKDKWTAIVTGPNAKQAVAEMVAALYDASLDQFQPHHWTAGFGVFRYDNSYIQSRYENQAQQLDWLWGNWPNPNSHVSVFYRHFPQEMIANLWGFEYQRRGMLRDRGGVGGAMPMAAAPAMEMAKNAMDKVSDAAPMRKNQDGLALAAGFVEGEETRQPSGGSNTGPQPDLSKIAPRKNLQETAFFFPHLISNSDGEVRLEFQMPEALTEWKFLGFAHDRDLRAGLLTGTTRTAKEIMVQPNPPRFLREGDSLAFSAKVTNQSAGRQQGSVKLTLTDARTAQNVDTQLGNTASELTFDIPAGESRSFSWLLKVPDDTGFLQYTVVGSTGRLSDGEEGFLPVLSRRVLVTESLPLPIRGPQTKQFDFTRLGDSAKSDTLRHQSLTVQMVSNPSWYAVMALPYLMEYPYECSEQSFNRLYANALARHIAQSDPKIHRIFEQWRGTPALDSPLEKNQDLKSVLIEETPWLRAAQAESQARRNVGILFDDNRLDAEVGRIMQKLAEQQLESGAWPWFPGGPANDYITLYITTGFARLRRLGVQLDMAPAIRSLDRLDAWADEQYRYIVKHHDPEKNHLSTTAALYLYCRSFYRTDKPIQPQHQDAVNFWLKQARTYWLQLAHRQSQAHLALALKRFEQNDSAQGIMRSLKERSVSNEELGMFWRDLELSWWWYHAPIETQALMIEAFDEVAGDAQAVEDCKVWLLKQKQTQNWKTTKATADAVYALLLRGSNVLASDALVEIALGGETIKPTTVEAGTGFYEQRFTRGEIKPEQAQITVKKTDPGVAWGSVHWQYLEDMSRVTPYEGTPLKLVKKLYIKQPSKSGPVLQPLVGPVKIGDELVVRIELRVDRDMEYVHLKDYRGSGTEPVNVLSQYKYQDGLAYYESTRDAASHFFIDYLPKGAYVFEYSTRVQHAGKYQTGMAQIQCMYAPEFNSHSESIVLAVE